MSKERELLKKATQIIETLGPDDEAYEFINEVDELLAQYDVAREDYKQKVINAFGEDDE